MVPLAQGVGEGEVGVGHWRCPLPVAVLAPKLYVLDACGVDFIGLSVGEYEAV